MDVSAVLVTRGDVDLREIVDSIGRAGVRDLLVWNNSFEPIDLKVFGRYAAMADVRNELVYVQDDDAVCPVAEIIAAYAGCDAPLLVNVPAGEKPWVAWGAVLHRGAAMLALDTYQHHYSTDDDFVSWADVIVSSFTAWESIDLGHRDLPWATAPNRMSLQPDHYPGQARVEARCLEIGGEVRRAPVTV